jgi:trans-2,3-dihydro-3-hydroxyanthranilate isomerase
MSHRFATYDVFTDQAFSGNPLAIVFDADDLDDGDMQLIAAEFNLSETVFMTQPNGRDAERALRIFTPTEELPFAGHPTVGAAAALAIGMEDDAGKRRRFVLEETIGDITADTRLNSEHHASARFFLPKMPERVGDMADVSLLARALGLKAGELMDAPLNDGIWSAGVPIGIVPLRDAGSLAKIRLDLVAFEEAFGGDAPFQAYIVAKASSTEHTNDWRVRMFAPHLGITEDPATGGAAAAFAGLLALEGGFADGDHSVTIYQGFEMGRPSTIRLLLRIENGTLGDAVIGGDVVKVSEGVLL